MTLHELLKTLTRDDIADIIDNQDTDRFNDLDDREEKIDIYDKFVKKLCNLTLAENSEENVLLGFFYHDNYMAEEKDKELVDTCVFTKEEILAATNMVSIWIYVTDEKELTDEEIKNIYEEKIKHGRLLPIGCAYEFSEWERVLGWDVNEENIRHIGKARFLANVLYEMSFNGFEEESQKERREALEERVAEVEELKTQPQEEWDKHFIEAEDLFNQLADEFEDESLRWTPPTEEEKKEMDRILQRDCIWNNKEKAAVMHNYITAENKRLVEEYPFLMLRNSWTDEMKENYDYSRTTMDMIPNGWRRVYGKCIREDIKRILGDRADEFRFLEIKEKYGALRMDDNGAPREWHIQNMKYEHLTEQTCFYCGKIGVPMTDTGWYLPICPKCFEREAEKRNSAKKYEDAVCVKEYTFSPKFEVSIYENGKDTVVEYDCSDILDRVAERYKNGDGDYWTLL